MKRILIGLIAGTLLAVPASAEIQTYLDSYVSFQYDDEMIGEISKTETGDPVYVMYEVNTSIKKNDPDVNYANLTISTNPYIINSITDEFENQKRTIISEDPLQVSIEYLDHPGTQTIVTVIGTHEDQAVTTSITSNNRESKNYEYCKQFIDSITLSELFNYEGYFFITKETGDSIMISDIFNNKRYSEQAILYAQKALDTCNQYLAMEISGEEAAKVFDELERRTKSYKDTSEYSSDSDVYFAVFLKSSSFKRGDDAKVMEIRDKLQVIVDCGTE